MANKSKWWKLFIGLGLAGTQFCVAKKINPKYQVKTYSIAAEKEELKQALKFVVLADYNGGDRLNSPEALIHDIVNVNPDAVFIVGNFFSKKGNDKNCVELVNQLTELYPIYMVPGKNEYALAGYEKLFSDLKHAGVHFLKNEQAILQVGKQRIEILGLDDIEAYVDLDEWAYRIQENLREQVPNGAQAYRIVLSHQTVPQFFFRSLDCHLVISANSHGGYIKLPLTRGLYAPKQGFFPRKTAGIYAIGRKKNKQGFVAKGLKTSYFIPRYRNRPELSVLKIEACQEK